MVQLICRVVHCNSNPTLRVPFVVPLALWDHFWRPAMALCVHMKFFILIIWATIIITVVANMTRSVGIYCNPSLGHEILTDPTLRIIGLSGWLEQPGSRFQSEMESDGRIQQDDNASQSFDLWHCSSFVMENITKGEHLEDPKSGRYCASYQCQLW